VQVWCWPSAEHSAPEGPGTIATGEAQRNPWKSRFSFRSAPEGRRNGCARTDQSKAYFRRTRRRERGACELLRPSGAIQTGYVFLRVSLRSPQPQPTTPPGPNSRSRRNWSSAGGPARNCPSPRTGRRDLLTTGSYCPSFERERQIVKPGTVGQDRPLLAKCRRRQFGTIWRTEPCGAPHPPCGHPQPPNRARLASRATRSAPRISPSAVCRNSSIDHGVGVATSMPTSAKARGISDADSMK
jgi:hypothetical protein